MYSTMSRYSRKRNRSRSRSNSSYRSKPFEHLKLMKKKKSPRYSESYKSIEFSELNNVSFGVELETCVLDTKLRNFIEDENFEEYFAKIYNKIYNDINKDYQSASFDPERFIYPEDDNLDYTKYNIVSDYSVSCSDDFDDKSFSPHLFFINENKKIERPTCKISKNNMFYAIEIVSPVITYDELFLSFASEFQDVILHKRFIYETNMSQGLHINISHPRQNKLKFLQCWWYFEPLIVSIVPIYRHNSPFARFLRLGDNPVFRTFEDINDWRMSYSQDKDNIPLNDLERLNAMVVREQDIKYRAVGVKDNRFEIRVINANMDFEHIVTWIEFLAKFLVISISIDTSQFRNKNKTKYMLRKELENIFGNDKDIIEELEMTFIDFQFRDMKIKKK